jgi:DNA-binding MarR family transcriptional regulator
MKKMTKKQGFSIPSPPRRCELGSNPVKLCHEISRLTGARVRGANIEGVMSQHGARLVLSALAVSDGASQRDIVEMTHLRPPTVSVILRKMQDEEIVELFKNLDDKRELRARLTQKGKEIDRHGLEKIRQTDALALRGLSEDEQATLMALLGRMRENLLVEQNNEEEE